ncbi:MAG TPA: GGDEF domain-containing protein [Herbaspirillum sp.]
MYLLDPRTTVLIGGITSGLMAFVLTMLARSTPLPVPGLRTWVIGAWLAFSSLVLLGLRDLVSPLASVTLGNSALLLTFIVWLAGSRHYFRSAMRWTPWLTFWVLAAFAVTWFVYGDESFRSRVVIVAGLCAYINIYHALVLLRTPRPEQFKKGIGVTLTASWLAALALVYLLRMLHAIAFPQGDMGLLTQDIVQIIYTGCFTICNLMLVIGFATIASDYVRAMIEEQAIRDPLTGVYNRQALVKCLEREFAQGMRGNHTFSVVMLDVDHFKKINDGHGHPIGDQVLIQLCRRMECLIRPHDVLARYGGEEFFIVMPATPLPEALLAAQRILVEAIQVEDPSLPGFTISIGVAEWTQTDVTTAALIVRADTALYQAKANGRNRIEIAGTSPERLPV